MSLGRARHGARRGAREGAAPGTNKGEVRPSSRGWRCPVTLGAIFQPQQSTNPLHLLASFPEAMKHMHPPRAGAGVDQSLTPLPQRAGGGFARHRGGSTAGALRSQQRPQAGVLQPRGWARQQRCPPSPARCQQRSSGMVTAGLGGGRAQQGPSSLRSPAGPSPWARGRARLHPDQRHRGGAAWALLAPAPSPGQAGAAWAGTGHAEPPEPSSALAFKTWPKGLGREG